MNLKELPYEYKAVNLVEDGGQQFKAEYGEKNPMHLVPSLQVGEHVVTESVAILEFLDEMYGGVMLLPKDPFLKAKVREIVNIVACDIHPVQNLRVVAKVEKDFGASRVEWGKYWVEYGFKGLEQIVAKSSGKYAVGDEISLADVLIVPQVMASVARYQTKAEDFPNLFRVATEASKLEAFRKAEPKYQPDAPAEAQ